MPSKANQFLLRYRATDSVFGVTKKTVKRLAAQLEVDETQVLHMALREYAQKHLPHYEADDGALTAAQLRQLREHFPQGTKRSIASSLFEAETA